MDEQLTNNIEVMTSFLSIFAYIIKELLTKSDMATNAMDGQGQQDRPNRGWYMPPLGRARNSVVDLTGRGIGLNTFFPPHVGSGLERGRGLRYPSPPYVDRGLMPFSRGRGLRTSSSPRVGRAQDFPQWGGRDLRSLSPPHARPSATPVPGGARARTPLQGGRGWRGED